jgi:2-polyprenyl-3-methyl-5-hydroxy-6-metoxy-1,4-benzoquinol methylase
MNESNRHRQREHYNRFRKPYYEKYLKNPESLQGISFPVEYWKPNRIVFEKMAASCSNNFHGKKILDLGCGEGKWSCYLASLGAEVVALDISEMNLKITELRAQLNGLTNIRTVLADCTNTSLDHNSFDIVIGIALIHHLTVNEEARLYQEVFDLLKQDGCAFFMECLQNSPTLDFIRTLVPISQKGDPRPSRLSKSWKKYIENEHHPSRPNTTKHYSEMLCNTRFKNFEFEELGIFSRLDRFTLNEKIRRTIHDVDYVIKPFIPFNSKLCRNIVLTLWK